MDSSSLEKLINNVESDSDFRSKEYVLVGDGNPSSTPPPEQRWLTEPLNRDPPQQSQSLPIWVLFRIFAFLWTLLSLLWYVVRFLLGIIPCIVLGRFYKVVPLVYDAESAERVIQGADLIILSRKTSTVEDVALKHPDNVIVVAPPGSNIPPMPALCRVSSLTEAVSKAAVYAQSRKISGCSIVVHRGVYLGPRLCGLVLVSSGFY